HDAQEPRCSSMQRLTLFNPRRAPWRKHRSALEDLVSAAQVVVLLQQPLELLALRKSTSAPAWRHYQPPHDAHACETSRRGCHARRRCERYGRSLFNASLIARWISSSGYFSGRAIGSEDPLPPKDAILESRSLSNPAWLNRRLDAVAPGRSASFAGGLAAAGALSVRNGWATSSRGAHAPS